MDNDGAKLLKENQFIISVPLIVAEQQFLRNEPRIEKEKVLFFFSPETKWFEWFNEKHELFALTLD